MENEDILDLVDRFKTGKLTPLQHPHQKLELIFNDSVNCNAFAFVDADAAIEQAEKSTQRWRTGNPLGPIDGRD